MMPARLDRPRLAILALHPVQYHAPLYREIAASGAVGGFVLIGGVLVMVGAFLTIELRPAVQEIPVDVAPPAPRDPGVLAKRTAAATAAAKTWAAETMDSVNRELKKTDSTKL